MAVRARVSGGAGCSGGDPINPIGLTRHLGGANYQTRDAEGLFPWVRGFWLGVGRGGGGDGGFGGGSCGGGGRGGRHGQGRAVALMNAGGGAFGRGAKSWRHPAAPPPRQSSLALGHGFASLSGDIDNDRGDGGDSDGQQPSRLEEPFSEDATELHSPSTRPPTKAQLRALTNAQKKVRLKALGLPVSGNKPVLIDRLEMAYGHRADDEPEDRVPPDNEPSDDEPPGHLETWRDACARVVRLDQVLMWTGPDVGRAAGAYTRLRFSST